MDTAPPLQNVALARDRFDAVIFDLDGVVTQTARVHAAAWKKLFDDYRDERMRRGEPAFDPFDIDHDYRLYVDGKPRTDGTRSFLEARGIELPFGDRDDPPGRETICGLSNRKNAAFVETLRRDGVRVYDSTVRLIGELGARGFKVAVISASRNCTEVLRAAGAGDLFDAQVDGEEAARLKLAGKPAPDVFLEAARRLGVKPERAVVVEDAIAGVRAGRAGGFGLVIGVDRTGQPARLSDNGAHLVVTDLAELTVGGDVGTEPAGMDKLPSALERLDEIVPRDGARPVVFLDYDGTLTPIVARPEDAVLDEAMRAILRRLAACCAVAIISGRGLHDVRERVGLDNLIYAGSHGFEIEGPGGLRKENEAARRFLPALEAAERELSPQLSRVPGAQIERKRFSIAIHYRNVNEGLEEAVADIVRTVARAHSSLRRTGGKKVFELQPDVDWDKGRAVMWLLEALGCDGDGARPIYIGDDLTDEDAFRALAGRGVGIVVRDQPRLTAARFALADTGEVREFLGRLESHLAKDAGNT